VLGRQIYSPHGQTYDSCGPDLLLSYKSPSRASSLHDGASPRPPRRDGLRLSRPNLLTPHARHLLIPVYIFYSISAGSGTGYQIGRFVYFISAAGSCIGATAGPDHLTGEGLQPTLTHSMRVWLSDHLSYAILDAA